MKKKFLAFIPLSNWLLGFDRYLYHFTKEHIPGSKFPDCFYLVDAENKNEIVHVYNKTKQLISRLNVENDCMICLEAHLEVSEQGAQPNTFTSTGIGWRWPSPQLPLHRVGWAHDENTIEWTSHEHITADSYQLNIPSLNSWEQCSPRSFSVLPIALACNASCPFCFSKASISSSVIPQKLDRQNIQYWAQKAVEKGATRAVITGGGEPTILPFPQLLELTSILGEHYSSILLINNGSMIDKWRRQNPEEALKKLQLLQQAGLTRIAISRHGVNEEMDAKILGIPVKSHEVMHLIQKAGISSRYICLLQKGGVETALDIENYLIRASSEGIQEVCFKELYVSSLSENPKSPSKENIYCMEHQIPLSLLIQTLTSLGFETHQQLPWGSPVYTGMIQGKPMKVAAYTEPSVGWERRHGIVRSWNLTSDGDCLASLEDPASILNRKQHEL